MLLVLRATLTQVIYREYTTAPQILHQRVPYPPLTTAQNHSSYNGIYIQATTIAYNTARECSKGTPGPTQ